MQHEACGIGFVRRRGSAVWLGGMVNEVDGEELLEDVEVPTARGGRGSGPKCTVRLASASASYVVISAGGLCVGAFRSQSLTPRSQTLTLDLYIVLMYRLYVILFRCEA
jgi:hypothetical protein